jgi:hypothetical protein
VLSQHRDLRSRLTLKSQQVMTGAWRVPEKLKSACSFFEIQSSTLKNFSHCTGSLLSLLILTICFPLVSFKRCLSFLFSQDRQSGKSDSSVVAKGELVMQVPHSTWVQGCGREDRVWVLKKCISTFAFSSDRFYHTGGHFIPGLWSYL